jgi:hypothetical protein
VAKMETREIYFNRELIGQFKLGTVVVIRGDKENHYTNTKNNVGHIVGFSLNIVNEVIARVKWADGDETYIHLNNLIAL